MLACVSGLSQTSRSGCEFEAAAYTPQAQQKPFLTNTNVAIFLYLRRRRLPYIFAAPIKCFTCENMLFPVSTSTELLWGKEIILFICSGLGILILECNANDAIKNPRYRLRENFGCLFSFQP